MRIGQHKGTVLITGASSGIGAVYADRLARRGYNLILVARNTERLRELTGQISDAASVAVEIITADLTDPLSLASVETVLRTDASIVMLVNNAGVGGAGDLLHADIARISGMIALNVLALTRLTYAAAPAFVSRGTGTIINIASASAIMPETVNGVYGGTKAFVLALSRSLHHELGRKGIRVQAVLPGATATAFWNLPDHGPAHMPPAILMSAGDMVDAALSGLDQGELVTIPALPDHADWMVFEAARVALAPNLSRTFPAERYGVASREAV